MNATTALTARRLTLTNASGGLARRDPGVARPPIMAIVAQIMNDNQARNVGGRK